LNTNGNLIIIASKTGKNTLLAGIIAMVQEAQSAKPPIQKLADKIASVFVPIVLALSALTFITWWIFGPQPSLTFAFLTTISVLIIACPCALGLATPTALMAGIGRGASQGILIRNPESLEIACKITAVIFDKTGTLTTGKPDATKSIWFNTDENLKQLLFSLEKNVYIHKPQLVNDHFIAFFSNCAGHVCLQHLFYPEAEKDFRDEIRLYQ